jgi:hypothetical protein
MPYRHLALDAWWADGQDLAGAAVPGTRFPDCGPDPSGEIRVPALAVPERMISDTPGRLPGKRCLSR